jgi:hypothetical protein
MTLAGLVIKLKLFLELIGKPNILSVSSIALSAEKHRILVTTGDKQYRITVREIKNG